MRHHVVHTWASPYEIPMVLIWCRCGLWQVDLCGTHPGPVWNVYGQTHINPYAVYFVHRFQIGHPIWVLPEAFVVQMWADRHGIHMLLI